MKTLRGLELPAGSTADLTAPTAGALLYGKQLAGKSVPIMREPSGMAYALAPHPIHRNLRYLRFGAGTSVTTLAQQVGVLPYTCVSGTAPVIVSPTTTSPAYRSTIATTSTAGIIASYRVTSGGVIMGQPWMAFFRFALPTTNQTAFRAFVGMLDVTTVPTNVDPVTASTPGGIGMAINAAVNSLQLVRNVTGTARTATSLSSFSASGRYVPNDINNLYDLVLWSDGTNVYWQTSVTVGYGTPADIGTGTLTTNIPTSGTILYPQAWVTNNTAAAVQSMDLLLCGVETDF